MFLRCSCETGSVAATMYHFEDNRKILDAFLEHLAPASTTPKGQRLTIAGEKSSPREKYFWEGFAGGGTLAEFRIEPMKCWW
jgi:hypothetical protein